MLNTQEHEDLMDSFERAYSARCRLDREPREHWRHGVIYQSGDTNALFGSYRSGYALGKVVGRDT